ncbi:hypothetical protein DFH06DRAFT_1320764 [Mycena polygramma]|nr:hypothetical protein DFH06DRAFT_1320764 [Mycena polygramma]
MADPVILIIDDKDFPALTRVNVSLVDDGESITIIPTTCYNGSLSVPQGQQGSDFWSWELEFDGLSVSLVGITPPSEYTINQMIEMDDPTKPFDPYTHPSAVGGELYTSDTQPAGPIEVLLSNANGFAIDYALVTARNSTNLQGQTIIVDDASPEIMWNGNWSARDNFTLQSVLYYIPSTAIYKAGRDPTVPLTDDDMHLFTANVSSHANTIHQSGNVGDSFTFQFAGTSLLISGISPLTAGNWLLHMEFTVDGNTTTNVFTGPGNVVDVTPHFVYFNATFDGAVVNHTLVAKVLSAVGDTPPVARIDHITYKPSFVTIADKPKFPPPASTPEPFDSSATSDMRERNGRSKREPLLVDANALAERRNDLAAEIQHLQESRHGEEDEQTMDERLRALQAQMDTLTHHLVPPSYAAV